MSVRWALGLGAFILSLVFSAAALPMKPNIEEMLKKAAAPKVEYPIARAGWNGPELPRKPFNPVYESMLYRISAEARRDELRRLAVPAPAVLASVFGIIVLLRMMGRERKRNAARRFQNVVVMPAPASEAA